MEKTNPFRIASFLFVPAIRKEFIDKIISLDGLNKPDGIIFDLEDAVHSDYKEEARENLKKLLSNKRLPQLRKKYIICVRINDSRTKWFKDDLKFVNIMKPDFLMLAKVESGQEIKIIRNKSKVKQLIVTVETLKGIKNISSIAAEMNFYDLLMPGYEDLSSELLIERPPNLNSENPVTYSLFKCLVEARNKGLLMSDAPSRKFFGQKALKEFKKECVFNRENGLSCKMAIHPNQVAVINKIFDKKIILDKAKKVLERFKNIKNGTFVVVDDHKEMIDTPSYKMYTRILEYWNK